MREFRTKKNPHNPTNRSLLNNAVGTQDCNFNFLVKNKITSNRKQNNFHNHLNQQKIPQTHLKLISFL